jgi:hypothetical protein
VPIDEIHSDVVLRRDVEHYVGVVAGEAGELRGHRHGDGNGRRDQAHDPGGLLTQPTNLRQRGGDAVEGRTQLREQAFPSLRGGDGPRRAGEEADANALLEPAYRVADRGRADPQPHRRLGEALILRHHRERREDVQLVAPH